MKGVTSVAAGTGSLAAAHPVSRWLVLALAVGALVILTVASILIGARPLSVSTVIDAISHYDHLSDEHIIVREYRLPRTLLGIIAGSAFGVSGALMQAATRNPLADPGILGVNAGAAFFVTLALGVFGFHSIEAYLWFALLGAMVVTLAVYALGAAGRDGATPVRLVLAGVALSAVLGGISSSIVLLDPQAFAALRYWSIGSLAGRNMSVVVTVAPFIMVGLIVAIGASRSLNAIALGDDLARSLGANIVRARVLSILAVTLLAGAATAAAAPIGFVGLMVPHVVRWLIGPDQRWIIPLTMVLSACLLLLADIAGRLIMLPDELEAGIVTALLGAPALIMLARRKKVIGL